MATIKDISKETGLGLATISKFINGGNVRDNNKILIEDAISKLGFTANNFARGLKTGKSYTVGVVIPELGNVFVTDIITIVSDILREKGYGVIVCDCRTDEARQCEAIKFLMGKMVDGIINMPVSSSGGHLDLPIDCGIPVLLIDRMIPELKDKVSAVLVDNVSVSYSAVKLLLDAGHRDIGVIAGPQEVFTSQQRLLGYNQALIQHSISPRQSNVEFTDYSIQGGYVGMKRLLKKTSITAVFTTNFCTTHGAIIALNELGYNIPDKISFVGFDNMELTRVIRPKLTMVAQPMKEIGCYTAKTLLAMLQGGFDDKPQQITLPAELIVGESVRHAG